MYESNRKKKKCKFVLCMIIIQCSVCDLPDVPEIPPFAPEQVPV